MRRTLARRPSGIRARARFRRHSSCKRWRRRNRGLCELRSGRCRRPLAGCREDQRQHVQIQRTAWISKALRSCRHCPACRVAQRNVADGRLDGGLRFVGRASKDQRRRVWASTFPPECSVFSERKRDHWFLQHKPDFLFREHLMGDMHFTPNA